MMTPDGAQGLRDASGVLLVALIALLVVVSKKNVSARIFKNHFLPPGCADKIHAA
jgi:hypothetical protein